MTKEQTAQLEKARELYGRARTAAVNHNRLLWEEWLKPSERKPRAVFTALMRRIAADLAREQRTRDDCRKCLWTRTHGTETTMARHCGRGHCPYLDAAFEIMRAFFAANAEHERRGLEDGFDFPSGLPDFPAI